MDTIQLPDIFNHNTISADGDIFFQRLYVAMYPKIKFIEDARPDYYITREEFDKLLKETYGNTGVSIYKSYLSGKCLDIRLIEEFRTMFFITLLIKEDMVDRNYRFSEKDLSLVDELGGIDQLQDRLDQTSSKDYNALELSPLVMEEELQHVILRVFYYPTEEADKALKFCQKYNNLKFDRATLKTPFDNAIYTLGQNSNGLVLHKHFLDTSKYKIDIIDSNYNDNFTSAYAKIIKFLKSDSNGLVLLTGEPGTGKSSLLMHLTSVCKELNTRFVFIPAAFASVLSDPGFLPFAVASLNNSVLILEDAEEILKDRAAGGCGTVSNILNITDGILGKLVQVKIIATVNKSHVIDAAIVRKGRLRLRYEFEKLVPEKANKLFTKLGKVSTTDVPMTLADIYNIEAETDEPTTLKKKKIGF